MTSHDHRSSYRQGDQIFCPACGKCWDVNDKDVPECISEREKGQQEEARRRARLNQQQGWGKAVKQRPRRNPYLKGF